MTNLSEGKAIEKAVNAMLGGSEPDDMSYDLKVGDKRVEVKSFYFFTGADNKLGRAKINKETHETGSCDIYVFMGKSKNKPKMRLFFVLTWDELDRIIRRYKLKAHNSGIGSNIPLYEISWMMLLSSRTHKKCKHFMEDSP
jgi:hypothetical protein